ncbi:MAG: Protein TolQ [Gemmatimonadaceae bacterium]|nr:Protein TolQ [Gemmatimonadaceae bacterium]
MTSGLWLQAGAAIPQTPLELMLSSTLVTKVVLGLLVLMSLVSWTIMLAKWREFGRMRQSTRVFLERFEGAHSVDEVAQVSRQGPSSPFTRVFDRAQQFIAETTPALSATPDRVARFSASQVEALRLVLDAQTDSERDNLTRYVPWLATIGSVSPLMGLLGTVLGVIEAFIGIATKGSGNIGAVAPGVAEALTATAMALAVAIPAVFGYNFFANRVNRFDSQLEGFGSELIALMVREGRM